MKSKYNFEIFAYCSKNYEDAFNFVIDSWIALSSVTKITIYTDWDLKYDNDKVEIIHKFEPSTDWIIGTSRRLEVIKDFSDKNKGAIKNILFLDIDCYIVKDVSEVFDWKFDIAISRLNSKELHANQTATAGLWFARLTPGYYNFINTWFAEARKLKQHKIGLIAHKISYVQYSFTNVARRSNVNYNVLPIDENIYNSEHTVSKKWLENIIKYKPKILHYKGRRFRDKQLVHKTLKRAKAE